MPSAKLEVQFGALRGVPSAFGDRKVVLAQFELRAHFGPVGTGGDSRRRGLSAGCDHVAAVREERDAGRNDEEIAVAERAREPSAALDELSGRDVWSASR